MQKNKINFRSNIIEYLKATPEQKHTAKQLAEWFVVHFPEESKTKKLSSKKINTDKQLLAQLRAEVSAIKKHPQIKATENRPYKYYWENKSDFDKITPVENNQEGQNSSFQTKKPSEYSLYPLLGQYLQTEFNLYVKRIDEKRSSNKQGLKANHWLHPDLVALEDQSKQWHRDVKECVKLYGSKRTRLWSFEVKTLLNTANVREAYFQTVSNSSWANYSYLVAIEISKKCIKELNMLSASHGVGVILLNQEVPEESSILIPAREREEINWEMVNRLVDENIDFKTYIDLVKQFFQTGKGEVKTDWDV